MLLNPVMANLHNMKTDRYHPIMFQERPQPSYKEGDKLIRSKSAGHHTLGFDTRDEAITECKKLAEKTNARLCISKDFPWDGEDTPAMVIFFGEKDGETVPIM